MLEFVQKKNQHVVSFYFQLHRQFVLIFAILHSSCLNFHNSVHPLSDQ